MKRIAVLTSGGDSPGMNAAIRSVVRTAHFRGLEVFGVLRGYRGLMEGAFEELGPRSVSNIIQRGGTILKTSRHGDFRTHKGLTQAAKMLDSRNIDGLIAIGGNGTYNGAIDLGKVWKKQIVTAPGTIDNDLYGTDSTIGYDTAVNTALEAIDKIRDTADSHERFFLIEVMGRHAGFIALDVAISGGAEEVLIPEMKESITVLGKRLLASEKKGKLSNILIVAEGSLHGGAFETAKKLTAVTGHDYRVVVLGHMQRGGTPTAADRILASELGSFAVEQLLKGKTGVAVGKRNGILVTTPLKEAVNRQKKVSAYLLNLLPKMSV
jgi:6-phosphofructokinase 1